MGYQLLRVEDDADFVPLFRSYRDGFTHPGTQLWPLFTGDYRPDDPVAREAALQESAQRFLAMHRADHSSTWLKVIDDQTGEIAAGGRWAIYDKERGSPYDGYKPKPATWYPDGWPRAVVTQLIAQFRSTSIRNMNRPHAFLNILWTVPTHRGNGCAGKIIKWGLHKADQLGLDAYVESTREGKASYESYGYETIEVSRFEIHDKELPPSEDEEEKRVITDALTPFSWWSMIKRAPE